MAQVTVWCRAPHHYELVVGDKPRSRREGFEHGNLAMATGPAGTVLVSDGFVSLAEGRHRLMIGGNPDTMEVVQVTAQSAGGTAVTVTRGCEGTIARAWPAGSVWRRVPIITDWQLP